MNDLVERYVEDVLAGRRVAGRWERAAVARHVRDMESGRDRGLWFDDGAGQHVLDFFGFLKHSKGEWAGRPFVLEGWQAFLLWSLFGWMQKDGLRRFRTAYIEIARKNGKSTLAAGIGLYLLDADGEPGAEVYTAATKRDQARIVHGEAIRMRDASRSLSARIQKFKDNLSVPSTASKYEPLGRDADSLDGLNVHGAIVDELHAHKNREMWDVLDTATGSRRQPLILGITTAGYDRKSVCWELHEYTEKVLSRVIEDDRHFGVVYGLDEGDAWEDEENWRKANPNLGVSKKWDDMRRKAARAKEAPAALNAFLRLELNVWTQVEKRWLDPEDWAGCKGDVDEGALAGRLCFAGLDLASTIDLAAVALVFPPEDGSGVYRVIWRFWCPADRIQERAHKDRVPYDAWQRGGWIRMTEGNVIDYDWILHDIEEMTQKFVIRRVAFDPWNASWMAQKLTNLGLETVEARQGFVSMTAPMKELEKLVISRKLAHGGNPVAAWMASNVVASQDAAGNLKPDRARSIEKIDGIVALVMALALAMRHDGSSGKSVYEERGVRVV